MISALRVVSSSGALPATVVMPSNSVWAAATTIAIASSCPGSQSKMTGRGVGLACDGESEGVELTPTSWSISVPTPRVRDPTGTAGNPGTSAPQRAPRLQLFARKFALWGATAFAELGQRVSVPSDVRVTRTPIHSPSHIAAARVRSVLRAQARRPSSSRHAA